MELEEMQAEMNMLFNEMVLADDAREVALLMLLADLCKGMNQRAGLRLQNVLNGIGESITTKPKEESAAQEEEEPVLHSV